MCVVLGSAIFGVEIVIDDLWGNVGDVIAEFVLKLLYALKVGCFGKLKVTLILLLSVRERVIRNRGHV